MICPQCNAEYRDGFYSCADCGVPLVHGEAHPTNALVPPPPPVQPGDPDEDPFCAFWRGDDPRIHAELCSILDEQRIPHRTLRRQDHLFNLNTKSAFTIGIPFSCFERAEHAVKDAYGPEEEEANATPANPFELVASHRDIAVSAGVIPHWLASANDHTKGLMADRTQRADESGTQAPTNEQAALWDPDDWYPEDASVEVWSGSPCEMAELLVASLRENQIHVRWQSLRASDALFVLPQDEARAREIVREVLQASAPE